jgi:hypothetical protein
MVFHNLYKLFIQTFLTLFQQYRYAYRVLSRFTGCDETSLAKKKSPARAGPYVRKIFSYPRKT